MYVEYTPEVLATLGRLESETDQKISEMESLHAAKMSAIAENHMAAMSMFHHQIFCLDQSFQVGEIDLVEYTTRKLSLIHNFEEATI